VEEKEVSSRQLPAECSSEKLPGEPETLLWPRADPSQGNAEKTDGFIIQHRRPCSLIKN